MSRAKTELENYLVYGIDELNRKIYFGTHLLSSDSEDVGDVTQNSVEFAIRAIERMSQDRPKTPIEIHMNSYGGDIYPMLALYDVIQNSSCQIKFYGKGAIMSAATIIMCGCDERYLYPNSRVMIHAVSTEMSGTMLDTKINIEESGYQQEKMEQIFEDNSRMPKNFWHEACKRDLFLSAEECVQLGLADRIVHPKKRGTLRKIRQHHLTQQVDQKKLTRLADRLLGRIGAAPKKMEIVIREVKPEPEDDRLVIEPLDTNNTGDTSND